MHQTVVGQAVEVVIEHVFQSVFAQGYFRHKAVAASQGELELHFHTGHYGVDAAGVKVGKTDAAGAEELMPGVFGVVLVVGVVDNALQVAFVVAYFKGEFKIYSMGVITFVVRWV